MISRILNDQPQISDIGEKNRNKQNLLNYNLYLVLICSSDIRLYFSCKQ